MEYQQHGGWLIATTIVLALALSIYPLPMEMRWWRPDWLVLVVFYWVVSAPQHVGIGWAWLAGLSLDILEGTSLGQNAFALSVIAYFALVSYQRLRMSSYRKQTLFVFFLVALHILLHQWVQNLLGIADISLMMLMQAAVSAAAWPIVRFVLNFLQWRFAVH